MNYQTYFELLDSETQEILRVYREFKRVYKQYAPVKEKAQDTFATTHNMVIDTFAIESTSNFWLKKIYSNGIWLTTGISTCTKRLAHGLIED